MRLAIASIAASDVLPSWISWATRPSSFEVGSAPSLTTLASAG